MITVTTRGAEEAVSRLRRAEGETRTAVERAVSRASVLLYNETALQFTGAGQSDPFLGKTGAPAPFLGTRTGKTRGAITKGGQVYRQGNTVASAVGSPDRHVAMHETGGTIQGKKFLKIPLAAAQTPAGALRGEFAGRSLRDVPDVFLRRSRAGNLFAWRAKGRGRGRKIQPLFLLKESVTLPPRRMFRAVKERATPKINAIVSAEVEVVMRRANNA